MSHFVAVLKKELMEGVRTYRIMIMVLVFIGLGILSPLTAKMTPEIIRAFVPEDMMTITVADPMAIDSWMQFYSNVSQIGIIVMIIVFSGILANEISRKTLIILLTKGLSRSSVILAKYIYAVLIWTVSLLLCFFVTLGYTVYLFPGEAVSNMLFALFCMWLFGVFLLAVQIFAATLMNHSYSCLLITGSVVVALLLVSIAPAAEKYNPLSLAALNIGLMVDVVKVSDMFWSIGISSGIALLLMAGAVLVFNKKQL
jgi:ABC-2 type transport system permease protein